MLFQKIIMTTVPGFLFAWGSFSLCGALAYAASPPPLPATAGPASIEVSRRAVRAWMQDWIDDSTLIQGERMKTCAIARLELAENFLPTPMAEIRDHLKSNFRHGRRSASGERETFLIPFSTPLQEISTTVALTPAEQGQMSLLQSRLDRLASEQKRGSPVFMTDQLRLIIDTTWWITQVSKRLYDEEIERHLELKDFLETAFKHTYFCQAYRIREMRNAELIRSGQVLLNTYLMLAAQD